jgi:hypothetical protein
MFMVAAQEPVGLVTETSAGQLIVGAVVSLTVKVVVQLLLLPAWSVTVTVIVCVPFPTMVPAAGV